MNEAGHSIEPSSYSRGPTTEWTDVWTRMNAHPHLKISVIMYVIILLYSCWKQDSGCNLKTFLWQLWEFLEYFHSALPDYWRRLYTMVEKVRKNLNSRSTHWLFSGFQLHLSCVIVFTQLCWALWGPLLYVGLEFKSGSSSVFIHLCIFALLY